MQDVYKRQGANSKNAMVPLVTVNTRNILFICGGAFPDLENIIKERLDVYKRQRYYSAEKKLFHREFVSFSAEEQ